MNKNVVWDIFNNFRGSVDANTLLDLTAYTLLLKHGELMAPYYYQENYSVRYLSRLYGDIILESDLCRYIEEIEKFYNIPVGIIAAPFANTIHKFDLERERNILLSFFRYLSDISFEAPEEIAYAFDYFLDMACSRIGKATTEYYTNNCLAKLEAALLDVKDGQQIYDPFCGSGRTIVAAGLNRNPLYVRDKNSSAVAIATINMILHGCEIGEVTCGDSLFAEYRKYDRVVSEPPLNVKYLDDVYESMKHFKAYISRDAIELETILDSLANNGKAVVLVPLGLCFRGGKTKEYRNHLLNENVIESIIALPSGVLTGTQATTALLVIDKKKENDEIMMIDSNSLWSKQNIKDYYLSEENIIKLIEIVAKHKVEKGISQAVSRETIIENDLNLTPTIYVTPFTTEDIEVKDINILVSRQKELEEELIKVSKELSKIRELG